MAKATLVIMAAGIGSRFGKGIKQLAPVGPSGEVILEYSIYDALEAGFDKVVFVIRKELEESFRNGIGQRIGEKVEVAYAYQEVEQIPEVYRGRFQKRTKPWGTGHAILCCRDLVDTPFLVINADDYYGKEGFGKAFAKLTGNTGMREGKLSMGMVGFILGNTLSENGAVTRGVCESRDGQLLKIRETEGIKRVGDRVVASKGAREISIEEDALVSMNMWCLPTELFEILEKGFGEFLEMLSQEEEKAEYLLPEVIDSLLCEKKGEVEVLLSRDKWFGVTYRQDTPAVVASIQKLVEKGDYPKKLFS